MVGRFDLTLPLTILPQTGAGREATTQNMESGDASRGQGASAVSETRSSLRRVADVRTAAPRLPRRLNAGSWRGPIRSPSVLAVVAPSGGRQKVITARGLELMAQRQRRSLCSTKFAEPSCFNDSPVALKRTQNVLSTASRASSLHGPQMIPSTAACAAC